MIETYVDTSYLIALLRHKDAWHEIALSFQTSTKGRLLTTEYVLVEFVDAMSSPRLRQHAVKWTQVLRNRSSVRVIPASTSLMEEGLFFFSNHKDKGWSLTDCISFVVMKREGVFDALSSDHHFEQAGFKAMLRDSNGH